MLRRRSLNKCIILVFRLLASAWYGLLNDSVHDNFSLWHILYAFIHTCILPTCVLCLITHWHLWTTWGFLEETCGGKNLTLISYFIQQRADNQVPLHQLLGEHIIRAWVRGQCSLSFPPCFRGTIFSKHSEAGSKFFWGLYIFTSGVSRVDSFV